MPEHTEEPHVARPTNDLLGRGGVQIGTVHRLIVGLTEETRHEEEGRRAGKAVRGDGRSATGRGVFVE